ncbi:24505_t:CDS:2, partial [Dentiscutata erythropus]
HQDKNQDKNKDESGNVKYVKKTEDTDMKKEKPKIEVEIKGDLPKTPGKIKFPELFKEKETNNLPPRLKSELPRKMTSLLTAKFEDSEKKSQTMTSTQICEKDKIEVEKSIEKSSNKITELNNKNGNTSTKLEDKPKVQEKKGDLPKVPGKLNVKGIFK